MTPLCPVTLSPTTLQLLGQSFRSDQARVRREILDAEGIEQRREEGIERAATRTTVPFCGSISAQANGGFCRMRGGW
jgi:hypothetical protein